MNSSPKLIFTFLLFLFTIIVLGQNSNSIVAIGNDKFAESFTYIFSFLIALSILVMVIMLIWIIIFEGIQVNDFSRRVVSFFIGLLIVISLDVIGGLKLSDLLISVYISDFSKFSEVFPAILSSLISFCFGIGTSYFVRKRITDYFIHNRIFILIATMLLFYMIRIYVIAIHQKDFIIMTANITFIIGYGLVLIFTPKDNYNEEDISHTNDNRRT